jgi:hypothetical protein
MNYWLRPPQTPASWRLVQLRYRLPVWAVVPPLARCRQDRLTVGEAVVRWVRRIIECDQLTATAEDDPNVYRVDRSGTAPAAPEATGTATESERRIGSIADVAC